MKNFSEERFPTDISYGISGGPKFNTDVITTHTGYEYRNINVLTARNHYNVVHGIKTKDQLDRLLIFFRAMRGKAVGFRFKDWLDYKAINQHIAIGDGKSFEFQLIKTYQLGDFVEQRKIFKPVENSVKIYFDNELALSWQINTVNGILTFPNPPKEQIKISADFEFDVPVRFDTDYISASIDNYNVHSMLNIPLIEIFL
jgi:uncharacterized protein (TIGR02217 family)